MWWHPGQFSQKKPNLLVRMAIIKAIRKHFDAQEFFEVETPILQVCPVMDTHIHAFKTALKGVDLKVKSTPYLHTSPEFAMKKLMVAGVGQLYQICHVFRNGEGSRRHAPEFTLVEWYRTGADYTDIMDDCVGLLRACANAAEITRYRYKELQCDPFTGWERLTVCEAFERYAGIDLTQYLPVSPPKSPRQVGGQRAEGTKQSATISSSINKINSDLSPPAGGVAPQLSPPASGETLQLSPPASGETPQLPPPASGETPQLPPPASGGIKGGGSKRQNFRQAVAALGLHTADDDGWDDLFFRVMEAKIEPFLGIGRPTFLCDYPASMASLSRKKPDDPRFAERFELYICGIELANAFSELTDAKEQRQRYEAEMAEKQRLYGERYPIDEEFIAALEYGMPESGGIALGIDRLIMLATGAEDIEDVLWTPI